MFNKKALIPFLFTIMILSAYSSMLTTRRAAAQAGYPVVSLTPTSSFAAVGENVNVSVIIANAVELFSYQVYISYSPDVVSVMKVTEGNLLKRGGSYATFFQPSNYTQGLIEIYASLFKGAQTVNGAGEAFIVTFTMNKPGGSQLHVHDVILTNVFRVNAEPVFTQDATISTAAVELTPSSIRPNAENDYSVNKTFDVNVTLEGDVSGLYTYDINVTYGNDVLEATAATLLPLMGEPNTNQTFIDNDDGTVRLSLECTPPAPSTGATGTLATITFRVLKPGTTDIEISNSTLADENGSQYFPVEGSASFSNQYANRNIGIVSSSLSSYEVNAGDNLTEAIAVRNDGSANETYVVIVHAYGSQDSMTNLVAGPSTFTIGANTTSTMTMNLTTTGLGGNYTVQAYIYYLPEETNYQDNAYTLTQELLVHPAVEESSPYGTTFYAAVAVIVILIAVVAAYLILRRRKTS